MIKLKFIFAQSNVSWTFLKIFDASSKHVCYYFFYNTLLQIYIQRKKGIKVTKIVITEKNDEKQ